MTTEPGPTPDFSDDILEHIAERVFRFQTAIAVIPEIRTLMVQAGMTNADIEEANGLLHALLPKAAAPSADVIATKAAAAIAELDQLDGPLLARVEAPLRRYHPQLASFVLAGLSSQQGRAAVGVVSQLLQRLELVEHDPKGERKDTRAADLEAIALLERRGITQAERQRLAKLVETALSPDMVEADLVDEDLDRRKTLVALKLWFDDWSSVARTVIKKRSHLISLGLASRRSKSEAPD
ncbi:MAG: hypothetical protein RBU37_18420 [Myxococcota bacterium]|jgi:hypothetical protein|nr:hypothetical protein [Myxococcota bacterium]